MKVTVDELDVFKHCGPTHLLERRDPWSNEGCERAVMACLVQAAYALDKDRSVTKINLDPLAPDWHLSFNYKLVRVLRETDLLEEEGESDQSIVKNGKRMQEMFGLMRNKALEEGKEARASESAVGAVFKWSRRLSMSLMRPSAAPKIVIAFRGTIPSGDTLSKDVAANLDVMMLQLHHNRRYKVAYRAVQQAITTYGASHVCLAGHSLGAALCLLIGQTLALEHNVFLRAHLFNPPFPSIFARRKQKNVAKGNEPEGNNGEDDDILSIITNGEDKTPSGSKFEHALHHWRPSIYINPNDPICKGYISHFREVDATSSRMTIRTFLQSLRGREVKPFHLIPSAELYYVDPPPPGEPFLRAHGMKQWWSQETRIQKRSSSIL